MDTGITCFLCPGELEQAWAKLEGQKEARSKAWTSAAEALASKGRKIPEANAKAWSSGIEVLASKGRKVIEQMKSLVDTFNELQAVSQASRADLRRMSDRARKRSCLNNRQLWRRRRAAGRGTRGERRK